MSKTSAQTQLSRRERQIMDVVYRLGKATVTDVLERLPDPPSYSAVRALMRILEEKGHLSHEQDGPRYVYLPTTARDEASRSALAHLLRTFFDNSRESAMAALLDLGGTPLADDEYQRLKTALEQAREPGDDE
jgi:BlaI family penicillinase repressor